MISKSTDTSKLALKAIVCGYQHVSKELRKRANKTSGDTRWLLKQQKRDLGIDAREHLLAYGLLRGIPYEKLENRCAIGNEPSAKRVLEIIQKHLGWRGRQWTETRVADLLKRGE